MAGYVRLCSLRCNQTCNIDPRDCIPLLECRKELPGSSAFAKTCSFGTKMNSASLSMKFLINHGHAIRSILARSLVIHFISKDVYLLQGDLFCNVELDFRCDRFTQRNPASFPHDLQLLFHKQ